MNRCMAMPWSPDPAIPVKSFILNLAAKAPRRAPGIEVRIAVAIMRLKTPLGLAQHPNWLLMC